MSTDKELPEMDAWFARIESECVVIDSPVPDCQHKSIVEVPGGTDCEDCDMTWRPNPDLEEYYYEIDTDFGIDDDMAESFFDPDDMYGNYRY